MKKFIKKTIFITLLFVNTKSFSTRVSMVEVKMAGSELTRNALVHQGLRFEFGFDAKECHFILHGLEVCPAGGYDNVSRYYSAVRPLGEVDKSIEESEEWCKKWARRHQYGVGAVCWTLVGEFSRAHGFKKHRTIRDPKFSEDCSIQ